MAAGSAGSTTNGLLVALSKNHPLAPPPPAIGKDLLLTNPYL